MPLRDMKKPHSNTDISGDSSNIGPSQNGTHLPRNEAVDPLSIHADRSRVRQESDSTAIDTDERQEIKSGARPTKDSTVVHTTTLPALQDNEKGPIDSRSIQAWLILKRLLPCVISVFLGSVFIVVNRLAFLSGTAQHAFLIIVIYTLFFHPAQHTVGKHIQVTVIGLTGAIVGIGWSALGYYLGCLSNKNASVAPGTTSVGARAACAVFLAAIAFVAADLKSRYPRLTTGCLLSVFASIWLLAVTVQDQIMTAAPFLGMLYAVSFAAGISLLVSIAVFPASSNKLLAQQLVDTLDLTSELFLATLHLFHADSRSVHSIKEYRRLCTRVLSLRRDLSSHVANLRPAYESARYEMTYALFPIDRYESFIDLTLRLQTILVSRMGMKLREDSSMSELAMIPDFEFRDTDSNKSAYLRTLVDELGRMNLLALDTIRRAVATSSYLPASTSLGKGNDFFKDGEGMNGIHDMYRAKELGKIRQRLDEIVDLFRGAIVTALEKALQDEGAAGQTRKLFRANAFRDCFFFTSLVELSSDIQNGLQMASLLPDPVKCRRRIWIPAIAVLFETSRTTFTFSEHVEEDEAAQRELEKEAEMRKQRAALAREAKSVSQLPFIQLKRHRRKCQVFSLTYWRQSLLSTRRTLEQWWNGPIVLDWRMTAHRSLESFKRSRHLKHAFKSAFGISLLTLPGHLPAQNSAFRWFEGVRGPWIAISFLYCLQTSTAATMRDALYRTIGTFSGAIYGLIGQKIAGRNPYGLVAVMTFQAFFTNYLIIFRPRYQGIGIVGQLTVPAILFVPYLNLEYSSVVKLAFLRAQDIEIGIVAALLLNTFLWPYHARVQLVTACAKATDKITKLYLSMSKQVLQRDYTMTDATRQQFEALEDETRMVLTRASNLCDLVHVEISLLPKPIEQYRSLIRDLNELTNLWSGLRAIRQHIPRKLTVLDVLPQRTELISSILIVLHAISHSLHTYSPVPQFLPHPHAALDHLVAAIEEHVESFALSPLNNGSSSSHPFPSLQSTLVGSSGETRLPSLGTASPARKADGKLGFSFAFALAENEAISEAVQTLSDIVETCRELYGVASFIQQDEVENFGENVSSSYLHTPLRSPTRSSRPSFSDPPVSPTRFSSSSRTIATSRDNLQNQ
ncbi:hypothetical protein P389DRAFT_107891 [Cystobasidium minutum MCA 4210]|uniref:uncharacterized protein n=1 Tax=Cystobasidium minutum MCA 4210 TaxID=1397322 RepID=UPI0034CFF894|eukprot:jgi/Rhomi1/107891/CE107890_604